MSHFQAALVQRWCKTVYNRMKRAKPVDNQTPSC